jgi:hypothetical protein
VSIRASSSDDDDIQVAEGDIVFQREWALCLDDFVHTNVRGCHINLEQQRGHKNAVRTEAGLNLGKCHDGPIYGHNW